MREPKDRVATYEDLYSIPDNMVGEIINGQLITHPRPSPKHALAASALGAKLFTEFNGQSADERPDWWILDEPECHLGDDVVVQDIAGWRKKTMPNLPDTNGFSIRPDWVCEVISPSTAKYDRGAKRDIYSREGVSHMWIVDPIERMIEVFALEGSAWLLATTVSDDQIVPLPPFETLPFDLSVLWVVEAS